MPSAPPRPCTAPGCTALVRRGRCPAHERTGWQDAQARRQHDERRGTAAQRGYGSAWTRIREQVIRDEPLCRHCGAQRRVTRAEIVDHIKPLAQGGTHDRANLQPLCRPCHHAKTLTDGSYGR